MLTKDELLKKYGNLPTKKIKVKAWGDAEVEIKKLSIVEKNNVEAMMLKDTDASKIENGKVEISIKEASASTILAVSYALVEPKLTVQDINNLSSDAMAGVMEIKEALDNWDKPKKQTPNNKAKA